MATTHCWFECDIPSYLLDRELILNDSHQHRVSGFKLALCSQEFRERLKVLRDEEIEEDNELEKHSSQTSRSRQASTLKSTRKRTRSLSEMRKKPLQVEYSNLRALEQVLTCVHLYEKDNSSRMQSKLPPLGDVSDFLAVCVHFRMPPILEMTKEHLLRQLSRDTCWEIWALSKQLLAHMPEFQEIVREYIVSNFAECCHSASMLQLELDDLMSLATAESLNIASELYLVELFHHWIDHLPTERMGHFLILLKSVKLNLLTHDELSQFYTMKYVASNLFDCQQLIANVSQQTGDRDPASQQQQHQLSSAPPTLDDLVQLQQYMKTPRLPVEAIFVIGGWEGNQSDPNFGPSPAIQVYDFRMDEWNRLVSPPMALSIGHAYSRSVFLDDRMFVIGGYCTSSPTQTLKEFNFETQDWRLLAPMHEKRNYVSACHLQGFIYAIGGHNGRVRLSSVERYDPAANYWSFVASMRQVRSDAGADTLKDRIYVCGGFDGERFYSSAEMYNPLVDQWTLIAPMADCRSGVSVMGYEDYLYVIGGNDGLNRLRTVERYNPTLDHWQSMPNMINKRSNFCTAILDNHVYAIGGWNDETSSTIASVERWNFDLQCEWKSVRGITMPASANSCCTVRGLENIREFLLRPS